MGKYTNPYVRLQSYYYWFNNNTNDIVIDECFANGISMQRISEISSIPLSIVRSDIAMLFQWKKDLDDFMDSNYDNISYFNIKHPAEFCFDGVYDIDINELICSIKNGDLDQIPIYNASYPNYYNIPISSEEATALYSCHKQMLLHLNKLYKTDYFVKDGYLFSSFNEQLFEYLRILNQAISDHSCCHMTYKGRKNIETTFDFYPIKIAYDATENQYWILSILNDQIMTNRLDCISKLSILSKPSPQIFYPEQRQIETLEKIAPTVWSCNYREAPQEIKVRFYQEANVWTKVKRDLSFRKNGKLYEKDGFLYYEDTVRGILSFKRWIFSYGSSAIVLKPESLRKEIIDSLKEREMYYSRATK